MYAKPGTDRNCPERRKKCANGMQEKVQIIPVELFASYMESSIR